MKLRDRINEIKRAKGICHYAEKGVESLILKHLEELDEDTLRKGVKVEIVADFHFFDIKVENKNTFHERMNDADDAIAEMQSYLNYFVQEDYKIEIIDEHPVHGFSVIL